MKMKSLGFVGKIVTRLVKSRPVTENWQREGNTLYRSEDGGKTWEKKTFPTVKAAKMAMGLA